MANTYQTIKLRLNASFLENFPNYGIHQIFIWNEISFFIEFLFRPNFLNLITWFNISAGQFPGALDNRVILFNCEYLLIIIHHKATNSKHGVSVHWDICFQIKWQPFVHHYKSISGMMEIESILVFLPNIAKLKIV